MHHGVRNRYPTNKSHVFVSNWFTIAFLITDSFSYLYFFSLSLSKNDLITLFPKYQMFNGDGLSLNNDNGNALLSRYVMLCHASDNGIR